MHQWHSACPAPFFTIKIGFGNGGAGETADAVASHLNMLLIDLQSGDEKDHNNRAKQNP